jgi:hypothetical protein
MPFVPIVDTAKFEIIGHHTMTEQPIVNVLHVAYPNTALPTYAATLANALDGVIGAHLNVWCDQYAYDFTRITDLNTATGPQAIQNAHAGNGTGGNSTATAACQLIKLVSALRSRRGRGRCFIGPCPSADLINDGTAWDPAYTTVVVNFFNAMVTALNALSPVSDLVIGSRANGTNSVVLQILGEVAPAYQRRRAQR